MINVIIVDDHKVVTKGFEHLINESGVAQVTGKAYSVAECRNILAKIQADVLLLDINLPDGNGIDLCTEIKTEYPELKILMLTSYSELSTISECWQTELRVIF